MLFIDDQMYIYFEAITLFSQYQGLMPQRKKNQNKQNCQNSKKSTIQHINYSQELRLHTLAPVEMIQAAGSVDLRKPCSRKPASRKSRCVSSKPPARPTMKFKQLVRQIKSMKLMQDREKSPVSSKSKPKNKKSTKKITRTQMNTNANSDLNITVKLERTLEKLSETDYFKDDDSLIPLVSSSDAFVSAERQNLNFEASENDEDINIYEIRAFCRSVYKRSIEFCKGNQYDIMARRIQRAWRRYRTHKIVNRYTDNILKLRQRSDYLIPEQVSPAQSLTSKKQEVMIQSDELYSEQMLRKMTYISNLEQEEDCEGSQAEQEQRRNNKKTSELEKWKQIVDIISKKVKNVSPKNIELLVKELSQKSEANQEQQHQTESNLNRRLPDPQEEEDSQKDQQFNSKKYIQYLDCDMYPIESNLVYPLSTISKQKQEQLLQKLRQPRFKKAKRKSYETKEFLDTLHANQHDLELKFLQLNRDINDESRLSFRSLQSISQNSISVDKLGQNKKEIGWYDSRQKSKKVSKNIEALLKCSSQKFIRTHQIQSKVINDMLQEREQEELVKEKDPSNQLKEDVEKQFEEDFYQSSQQREFLHNNPIEPSEEDDFVKLYSEEELTRKLAELKQKENEYLDSEDFRKDKENSSDEEPILLRTDNQGIEKIKKINLQYNDQSDEDKSEIAQKAESVANMIFNALVFDILKQMAKYPEKMLKKLKESSNKQRQTEAIQSKQRKNGFSTNQAEIKAILHEITTYLLNQESHVFKNLERATGPSALEMLRYMHQSSEEQIYLEDEEDDPSVMVMPNRVFDQFWERMHVSLKYDKHGFHKQRQQQRIEYLKSLNKIFYRSLFDCLNECLDFQRNYGPFGRPFPWKKTPMFNHVLTFSEINKTVERSQKRLLDVSCTYCGIIIEKQQMTSICGTEDYLQQVQEDRLSRMLAQDLIEGEQRWIFYDDEQTEILVEVSTYIFQELIHQISQTL